MAGLGDSGAAVKKASDGVDDVPTFSAENLQSNMKVIYYSRTFLSIIAGVIAGILGFTSLTGFIFYFVVMAITSVGLAAKAKFLVHSYFDSWNRVIFDGFLSGLMGSVIAHLTIIDNIVLITYGAQSLHLLTNFSFSIPWQSFVLFWTFAYDIVHIF